MWVLATSTVSSANSLLGLNPIYLLTGTIAAIVAIVISLRSIVKSMIARSKEEAVEKEAHNEALKTNTRAIEKLDSTTDKLADKLDKFTFDATIRLNDHERSLNDVHRRLDRIERANDGKEK